MRMMCREVQVVIGRLFADNAKLLRKVRSEGDCKELQNDLNRLCE